MVAIVTDPVDITDSELTESINPQARAIAVHVARQLQLAAEKVAANAAKPGDFPLPDDPRSAERILSERFAALPARTRETASATVLDRLASSRDVRIRRLGDLAGVDLASPAPVAEQVTKLPFPAALRFSPDVLGKATDGQGGPASFSPMSRLELRVHRVICVDETDGFLGSEAGSDEISLGGLAVDPAATTTKIPAFDVGDFESDGVVVPFSPPRSLATFSLTGAGKFPKSCFVTFALAEIDAGGFADFLNKLAPAVKSAVTSAVTTAIGGAIGSAAGPLGSIIGAAVGLAIGLLFDFLSSVWNDDIFDPVTVTTTIPALNSRFPGGATDSPDKTATFTGHGGKYQIVYDWHMLP